MKDRSNWSYTREDCTPHRVICRRKLAYILYSLALCICYLTFRSNEFTYASFSSPPLSCSCRVRVAEWQGKKYSQDSKDVMWWFNGMGDFLVVTYRSYATMMTATFEIPSLLRTVRWNCDQKVLHVQVIKCWRQVVLTSITGWDWV